MENEKSLLQSKTLWFVIIDAVCISFDGPIQDWVNSNPGMHSSVVLFVFTFLRLLTKHRVKLW